MTRQMIASNADRSATRAAASTAHPVRVTFISGETNRAYGTLDLKVNAIDTIQAMAKAKLIASQCVLNEPGLYPVLDFDITIPDTSEG